MAMRLVLLVWLALAAACSDSDPADKEASGSGGEAGNAGNAGSAGEGGAGGAGGAGGSGGSAGVGGAGDDGGVAGVGVSGGVGGGGDGGVGGDAGVGGVSARPQECEVDSDCKVAGDCCTCVAVPSDTDVPPVCRVACEEDRCTQLGVSAICAAGRCTFDATCDESVVTCGRAPPECPPGERALVQRDCWGDCVDARECRGVTSCDVCTGDQVCVSPTATGLAAPPGSTYQCWDVAPECNGTPTCECMGDAICDPFSCSDSSQDETGRVGIGCFCVLC